MDIDASHRVGRLAVTGGTLALVGALIPFDVVFLVAAGACALLALAAWRMSVTMHAVPDPVRHAGGAVAAGGLVVALVGFVAAFAATLVDRPDVVFASLSTAVSTGLYVMTPIGLVLAGLRLARIPELGPLGRSAPLLVGICGVVAIPATVLISLPRFEPGQFATLLGILREVVLIGWLAIGLGLLRAAPHER